MPGSRPKYDSSERAYIASMYSAGLTGPEIAAELGDITDNTVMSYVHEFGVAVRSSGKRPGAYNFPSTVRQAAVDMYVKGVPATIVAAKFKCSSTTVSAWVRAAGETMRRPAHDKSKNSAICDMYSDGASPKDIAAEFGVSSTVVRNVLHENGIGNLRGVRFPYGALYKNGHGYLLRTLHPDYWLHQYGSKRTRSAARSMFEHRRVMAEHLGRPLKSEETVHHLNGNRDDNRIENLELHSTNHGPGQHWVCANCGCSDRKAVPLNG